jgi:phage terminase large subunit
MGPGTYEWETRVLANFWSIGEGQLIPADWVDRNNRPGSWRDEQTGIVQLGVDMATYGVDENVIVTRWGNDVIDLKAYPSMRQDLFWDGPVLDMVRKHGATYLCYDADGVGAGVIGYAQRITDATGCQLIPFRGAININDSQLNARATWWWALRRRFENNDIKLRIADDYKLREQLSNIAYTIPNGKIKVETKAEMKKRGVGSPDRADALVYAFAVSEGMPQVFVPHVPPPGSAEDLTGTLDLSERAMFLRMQTQYREPERAMNPVMDCPDDW